MAKRPIAWGILDADGTLAIVFDTKKEALAYKRDARDEGRIVPLYTTERM